MITFYVITSGTSDYPGQVVLRAHKSVNGEVVPDREPLAVGKTVESVRDRVPSSATPLPVYTFDDPVIVECWATFE